MILTRFAFGFVVTQIYHPNFFLFEFSGWVIQTIFIDCSNPDSCQESNKTNESNQQCPNFLLSASEDGTIKLWDLTNKGAIVLNLEQCAGISCMIASKLKGIIANFCIKDIR